MPNLEFAATSRKMHFLLSALALKAEIEKQLADFSSFGVRRSGTAVIDRHLSANQLSSLLPAFAANSQKSLFFSLERFQPPAPVIIRCMLAPVQDESSTGCDGLVSSWLTLVSLVRILRSN